jgi:hypothetical protein
VLKARATWPATARVYCRRFEDGSPEEPEIVEQAPARLCRRRGAAIDLVPDRPRLSRSQFVFTEVRGREAIFWQTQKTARAANPGARILCGRTLAGPVAIAFERASAFPTPSVATRPRRRG